MISCRVTAESWQFIEPFGIARAVTTEQQLIHVKLTDAQGRTGQAEAAGVDYEGETIAGMAEQVRRVAPHLSESLAVSALQELMSRGGARNAVDCALWDLRAKQTGVPVWQAAGLAVPRPLLTAFTLGLGTAAEIRRKARAAINYPLLKLKVDSHRHIDVVNAVRAEHANARLIVDANQSWPIELLKELLPALAAAGVELIEQPVACGADAVLDGLNSPIPIAADESCTDRASLPGLVGRYQYVNIKLDKCGGFTEALALASAAEQLGFGLMVGNMCGSSLGMAPAFLIGQRCRYVDIDGPLLQQLDREVPMVFEGAMVHCPLPALWG